MNMARWTGNKVASAALRGITGAFILNSGIGKLGLRGEVAEALQEMAAVGVPALAKLSPDDFGKFISYSEVGIGSALLLPVVPRRLAGAALTTFGAGLLTIYFNSEGMTEDDGIRPTKEGNDLAKNSWLVAAGIALMAMPKD